MISINIEREMKLEAIKSILEGWLLKESKQREVAMKILDAIDNVELSTQEAWMAEEKASEAEMTAEYSREAC